MHTAILNLLLASMARLAVTPVNCWHGETIARGGRWLELAGGTANANEAKRSKYVA